MPDLQIFPVLALRLWKAGTGESYMEGRGLIAVQALACVLDRYLLKQT